MAGGSTLDPDNLTGVGSSSGPTGTETGSLGPSDTTDSGSDVAGGSALSGEELASDTDAAGTGDRAGVAGDIESDSDIGFDQVVNADDAGLGTGLDEAELARGQD